jgi:hypothetical protein
VADLKVVMEASRMDSKLSKPNLAINKTPGRFSTANGSMTVARKNREIKRRIMTKGKQVNISGLDLAALIHNMIEASLNPKVGFNHATTDIVGWFSSLAPYGVTIDEAFLEDMLSSSNMLDEIGKFKHPLNISFDKLVSRVTTPTQKFDKDTNTITGK